MCEEKLKILDGIHGSKVIRIYETNTGEIVQGKKKDMKKWIIRLVDEYPQYDLEFKIVEDN